MNKTHQESVFEVMIWDSCREGYTVILTMSTRSPVNLMDLLGLIKSTFNSIRHKTRPGPGPCPHATSYPLAGTGMAFITMLYITYNV